MIAELRFVPPRCHGEEEESPEDTHITTEQQEGVFFFLLFFSGGKVDGKINKPHRIKPMCWKLEAASPTCPDSG